MITASIGPLRRCSQARRTFSAGTTALHSEYHAVDGGVRKLVTDGMGKFGRRQVGPAWAGMVPPSAHPGGAGEKVVGGQSECENTLFM